MAVTRKPKRAEEPTDITRLVRRGRGKPSREMLKGRLKVNVRAPLAWIDRVDSLVKARLAKPKDTSDLFAVNEPKFTRHDWLLEAIREKIERESASLDQVETPAIAQKESA
jgi:hypothetical protein